MEHDDDDPAPPAHPRPSFRFDGAREAVAVATAPVIPFSAGRLAVRVHVHGHRMETRALLVAQLKVRNA